MSRSTSAVATEFRPMPALEGLQGLTEQVFLQLQHAAEGLMAQTEELLKDVGLSSTQYNTLRILRGAGAEGAACQEIICQMIKRDPDMTRLLDKLQSRGLVTRERCRQDRRVVRTYLTTAGLELVEQLDEPIAQLHLRQLGHLGAERLAELGQTLREVQGTQPCGECDGNS